MADLVWVNGPFGGGKTWGLSFAEHIRTDRLTVPQVADRIAASAGLTLLPDTDSALRHRVRRTWTGIRHIRLD